MATIKQTSNTLGNLLNQINSAIPSTPTGQFQSSFGVSAPTNNPTNGFGPGNNFGASPNIGIDDDSIPTNMLEPAPVFEMNYKSTKKQCVKKAKDQLSIIVKEVVPSLLQNSAMITDKIAQDAEQLGNLYYAWEQSDKVIQACMETIARGETQARLFDTYAKLQEGQQKLSVKITETQNQMRKYYIDTYLDLQQKDEADGNATALPNSKQIAIEAAEPEPTQEKSPNVIVGTDQTIKILAEKKKKAMMAKYEEVKD